MHLIIRKLELWPKPAGWNQVETEFILTNNILLCSGFPAETVPVQHCKTPTPVTAAAPCLPPPPVPPCWHLPSTQSTSSHLPPPPPTAWPTCPACRSPRWSCCTGRRTSPTSRPKVGDRPGWSLRRGGRGRGKKGKRRRRW